MALSPLLRRTTWLDRVIVLAVLLAGLGGVVLAGTGARGERVVVERDGKVIFTAPLAEERTALLEGPLGAALLSIHGGKVCILESPCPLKVCIGMGEVAREGELLACVPNHLLVRIEGRGGQRREDYDLISR
ncbi:hypothetical protein DESUT3_39240 [Desulfuromonas versatilis]|uniref:NusG domain-containing protein n=1 Tax=Desulfuromonas versatilis TaxID=2802975 RepID=A0ABN6E3B8_9BACT|nr:NusG domain II-containing protein [Desulfuromonas versatilis]BCR06855.1 hypothetical protein DESUT3_39240 [Desulfuromonas versatilis]